MAQNRTIVASHAFQPKGMIARTLRSCADFLDRMDAAIRVARAVENRRAPRAEDLVILGVVR